MNHNPNWPCIPDHRCRIFIMVGSVSGETNGLLNLVKHQRPDIDKIYLYIKDPLESNNELLVNGSKKEGIENLEI